MDKKERRKYPRVRIYDPISYLSVDSKSGVWLQNVAVARNISKTGIQIESFLEVNSKYLSLMFFDLEKHQIEVKGEVVYCKRNEAGQFQIGISFVGTADENLQFVRALVKAYHYQKDKSHMVVSPGIQN